MTLFPAAKDDFTAENGVTYTWEDNRWRTKAYRLDDEALDDEAPAEQMGIKELKAALRVAGVDTSKMLDKAELVSALNKYRIEQRPTNAAADAAPPTKKAAPSDGGTGSGVQHDPTEAIDWLHEQSKAALESLRQPNFVEHRKIEERLRGILSALQPRDPGGGSSSTDRARFGLGITVAGSRTIRICSSNVPPNLATNIVSRTGKQTLSGVEDDPGHLKWKMRCKVMGRQLKAVNAAVVLHQELAATKLTDLLDAADCGLTAVNEGSGKFVDE